ncbi:hypothetical protein [Chondromyces crocatus]|uniref:Uncharacterized protein n=1 Tax=Chondromyces crocatus TaxID=52 RepID=A0A0K1EEV7_CHOCO|nr:hypothetical protein [Chondromyces crocatus]AKT39222.1 uncharacterized protein CMC5_033710 [Chondromyces crocatus]
MQLPKMKTPVSRCDELAAYSTRMMSKFPSNPVLTQLATRLDDARTALVAIQAAYQTAVRTALPTRVDVKYADIAADRCVRRLQKKAEHRDGKRGGPTAAMIMPKGSAVITRLRGESQVKAMIDLEADVTAAVPGWSEAPTLLTEVVQHREDYQGALSDRTSARQTARAQRALRDAEKARFLKVYEEVARTVQAQFPGDREMQDLFFDEVRRRSVTQAADSDDDPLDEDDDELECPPSVSAPR